MQPLHHLIHFCPKNIAGNTPNRPSSPSVTEPPSPSKPSNPATSVGSEHTARLPCLPRPNPDRDPGRTTPVVRRHHSHRESPPRPSVIFLDFFVKLPWGFCSPHDSEHTGTNHVDFGGETKPESEFEDRDIFGRTPSARPNASRHLVRACPSSVAEYRAGPTSDLKFYSFDPELWSKWHFYPLDPNFLHFWSQNIYKNDPQVSKMTIWPLDFLKWQFLSQKQYFLQFRSKSITFWSLKFYFGRNSPWTCEFQHLFNSAPGLIVSRITNHSPGRITII